MKKWVNRVKDEESGIVYPANEMVTLWDGRVVNAKNYEIEHPQLYIRAKEDPTICNLIRKDLDFDAHKVEIVTIGSAVTTIDSTKFIDYVAPDTSLSLIIGSTSEFDLLTQTTIASATPVPIDYTTLGAAAHLFKPGIGGMVIEGGNENTRFEVS